MGIEGEEGREFGARGFGRFGGFGAGWFRGALEFGWEGDAQEAGDGAQGAAERF